MKIYVLLCALTAVADSFLVQFFLYTSPNQNDSVMVGTNNVTKFIKKEYDIKIFIHGWQNNGTDEWYPGLRNAFFSRGNVNIIEVNWSDLAKRDYPTAVAGSPLIATQIGDLIIALVHEGYPLKKIEPIGHSLGAQIAGFIGKSIPSKLSEKLARITGLDPAGPLFQPSLMPSTHLIKSDAQVVLAIHTNILGYGYSSNCGTIDVYPNGGDSQPGCSLLNPIPCNHNKSWMYFIAAVAKPKSLVAVKCENYADFLKGKCDNGRKIDLGGNLSADDEGTYYLKTAAEAPFTLNP